MYARSPGTSDELHESFLVHGHARLLNYFLALNIVVGKYVLHPMTAVRIMQQRKLHVGGLNGQQRHPVFIGLVRQKVDDGVAGEFIIRVVIHKARAGRRAYRESTTSKDTEQKHRPIWRVVLRELSAENQREQTPRSIPEIGRIQPGSLQTEFWQCPARRQKIYPPFAR